MYAPVIKTLRSSLLYVLQQMLQSSIYEYYFRLADVRSDLSRQPCYVNYILRDSTKAAEVVFCHAESEAMDCMFVTDLKFIITTV
jgi:hypothetical protein